ncbi:MAG TPA: cyclase family protein [Methylomirabilota bacterium]|nr:cyclase family protein [Methylomirabilota bacterium]
MQPGWLKEFWRKQEEPAVPEESTEAARPEAVSRRSFVKAGVVGGVAAGVAAGQVVAQAQAQPAAANPLSAGNWWPSPWGAQDQRGANNRITPAKVLEAARLIKTGKIYPLGRVLEKGIPLFGERLGAHVVIPGSPTGGPFGNQKLYYHDELFVGEIGQAGSQFDSLGHIGMVATDGKLRYYNGLTQEEVGGTYGLKKLGIENCRPFFTRGILLDVLALKGGDRLPIDYVITVADIEAALKRQNTRAPGEADAVIFHTGHGTLWKKDNAEYNKGCPGPGISAGRWLADKKIAVVGADTWPVEAVPGENPNLPFACHAIWLTLNGIYINENLDTSELAKDRVYEFAWSFNPVPIKGATGAPGNSVAIA